MSCSENHWKFNFGLGRHSFGYDISHASQKNTSTVLNEECFDHRIKFVWSRLQHKWKLARFSVNRSDTDSTNMYSWLHCHIRCESCENVPCLGLHLLLHFSGSSGFCTCGFVKKRRHVLCSLNLKVNSQIIYPLLRDAGQLHECTSLKIRSRF